MIRGNYAKNSSDQM